MKYKYDDLDKAKSFKILSKEELESLRAKNLHMDLDKEMTEPLMEEIIKEIIKRNNKLINDIEEKI